MDDGSDDNVSSAVILPLLNGEVTKEVMANFPNTEDSNKSPLKINGEKDSSDCDALVIDESVKPPKKKRLKKTEEFTHTNPYFSESIFDLSTQYQKPNESEPVDDNKGNNNTVININKKVTNVKKGKNGKHKLREYAQYLGLQPTVQFKCSKCTLSGFQTLQALNEHLTECTSKIPPNLPTPVQNNTTNFRVTRKVFLCSACGTYYENWNLFLHMKEVHKRFICLYCLGMFPHAEKLSLHLISKHNCKPSRFETADEFFNDNREPCFLMCCDCQVVFNEQDDVYNHKCITAPLNKQSSATETTTTDNLLDNKSDLNNVIEDIPSNKLINEATIISTENAEEMKSTESEVQQVNINNQEPCDKISEHQLSNMIVDDTNNKEVIENNVISEKNTIENESSVVDEETELLVQDKVLDSPSDTINDNNTTTDAQQDQQQPNNTSSDNIAEAEPEKGDELDESLDENVNEADDMEEDVVGDEGISEDEPETRKVPKITVKLPKITQYNPEQDDDEYQSEDSEKLTMEIEKESDQDQEEVEDEEEAVIEEEELKDEISVPTAGLDVGIIELELEQPLDKFDIQVLLQKCLSATIVSCLFCNHARKIAVNGKQLGLHAIAEHRYAAIVKSITAEELIPESFNARIKESFAELETLHFNLEADNQVGGVTFSHIFECFQCRYSTTVHKELYLHNRKLHAKAMLLCIMCKKSFYSYSELICHLCPGEYALDNDVGFRCCLCVSGDIPSAFRLMVHLRKKHHVCDVCLEMCHNQSRLSNHVWKHKLHHLCYRCGIAYRNKPDITKHLFWKHGTESVLCKRCLNKKWPHVYHFCIPPTNFPCEECSLTFMRAVGLLVHKRLHSETYPHACSENDCDLKFISKKLLLKHEFKHREPPEVIKQEEEIKIEIEALPEIEPIPEKIETPIEPVDEIEDIKPKTKVDVYDLPELNLSESDSSDSEIDAPKMNEDAPTVDTLDGSILEAPTSDVVISEVNANASMKVPFLENIWDNFKNYQANIGKLDILTDVGSNDEPEVITSILTDIPVPITLEEALLDHDYCAPTMDVLKEDEGLSGKLELSADHDYCTQGIAKKEEPKLEPPEAPLIPNKTSSSSGSDSSSCTCGSNCSCSSSSGSSSSTSDSSESDSSSEEGRRRQQVRRERRRTKKTKKDPNAKNRPIELTNAAAALAASTLATKVAEVKSAALLVVAPPVDAPIQESDLETTESDTDEEFYDKEPQKLANKILAEKRERLLQLAGIGPYINGSSLIDSRPSTPSLPETEQQEQQSVSKKAKKVKKLKKKKKKKKSKRNERNALALQENIKENNTTYQHHQQPTIAPFTLTIPRNSPIASPHLNTHAPTTPNNSTVAAHAPNNLSLQFHHQQQQQDPNDSNTRASKRRRVPNKFYGYSSDEDGEKPPPPPVLKWRKVDLPTPKSPLVVPPLTIKTTPTVSPHHHHHTTTPSTPTVEPISIRMSTNPGELRVAPIRVPIPKTPINRIRPTRPPPQTITAPPIIPPHIPDADTGSESNTSSDDEASPPTPAVAAPTLHHHHMLPPVAHLQTSVGGGAGVNKKDIPALYCYCRCPYDEVSEMIGCDADDCAIEWFHFECVGIMVPPKGQWYCPDCRKKKQQRRDSLQMQMSS